MVENSFDVSKIEQIMKVNGNTKYLFIKKRGLNRYHKMVYNIKI